MAADIHVAGKPAHNQFFDRLFKGNKKLLRVLTPHSPDVLVGADLRVRQEEDNNTGGLPLHRPGPIRRHPLQMPQIHIQ